MHEEEEEDHGEFKDMDEFNEKRQGGSLNESEIRLDQDIEAERVEPLLESFSGYAGSTLSLIFNVCLIILTHIAHFHIVVVDLLQ